MFIRFRYLLAKDEYMLFTEMLLSVSFNCQSIISNALHKLFLFFKLTSRYNILCSLGVLIDNGKIKYIGKR